MFKALGEQLDADDAERIVRLRSSFLLLPLLRKRANVLPLLRCIFTYGKASQVKGSFSPLQLTQGGLSAGNENMCY